jgi:hypothetical protein
VPAEGPQGRSAIFFRPAGAPGIAADSPAVARNFLTRVRERWRFSTLFK